MTFQFPSCTGVPEIIRAHGMWFARLGSVEAGGFSWEEAWDNLAAKLERVQ